MGPARRAPVPTPPPIELRTRAQMDAIARAGAVVGACLTLARSMCIPGTRPADIARAVRERVEALGARPVLLGYRSGTTPPFPSALCVSVDDAVLHGVPTDAPLRAGSIVSLDLAASVDGWFADAACTVGVGEPSALPARAALAMRAARACADAALCAVAPGVRWPVVAEGVAQVAREHGVALVPGFDGHGIGRRLHEPPRCRLVGLTSEDDFVLRPGMVLTLEPTVLSGGAGVRTDADGWTVRSADGAPGAHHELTVGVVRGGARVLVDPLATPAPDIETARGRTGVETGAG